MLTVMCRKKVTLGKQRYKFQETKESSQDQDSNIVAKEPSWSSKTKVYLFFLSMWHDEKKVDAQLFLKCYYIVYEVKLSTLCVLFFEVATFLLNFDCTCFPQQILALRWRWWCVVVWTNTSSILWSKCICKLGHFQSCVFTISLKVDVIGVQTHKTWAARMDGRLKIQERH